MRTIAVTVVYALPDGATEIALELPAGATVADAIARSRIAERHPHAALHRAPAGIFGKRAGRETMLADGDRVELYRPLQADPKAARRRRASARGAR
jgi:putative ubiquitin-RnfH superfamily antitoxin RatB of RatAB toxin-antitoxin module